MGKSTAASYLRATGIALLDSDDLARDVVGPGQPALDEIQGTFGRHIITPQGELNREELARIVFTDPEARRRLEAITHPRIKQLWEQHLATWRRNGERFGVVVIPLLYEVGMEAGFDEVVCVACSAPTQLARLRARGWSPAECQQRIAAQMPSSEKLARAHHVVWTEGAEELTRAQLDRLFAD